MACPLDCEYLREARKHEEPPIADPETFPNKDIEISEEFLRKNEHLLLFLSVKLLQASTQIPNLVDGDIKTALDALVRTHRTLQSGLVYQTRPENMLAAALCDRMLAAVEELRKAVAERTGTQSVRDADVLGIFAFLQRMEIQQNNGRRLGRAFVDFLREQFPEAATSAEPSSLIV